MRLKNSISRPDFKKKQISYTSHCAFILWEWFDLSAMCEKADEFQCGPYKSYSVWFIYFYIFFFLSDSFVSDLRYHRNNVTNGMMWSCPLNLCEWGSFSFNRRECISEFNYKIFLLLRSATFQHIRSGCSFASDDVCGSNIYSSLAMFLECWHENTASSHI